MTLNTTPQQTRPFTQRLVLGVACLTFITLIASMPNTAHAIDEPAFTVVQTTDVFEVRQYAPYLVAEVVVPGPANEAGSQGFNLLGGYIFGKNKGERKLDMTAPVTQSAAPGDFWCSLSCPKATRWPPSPSRWTHASSCAKCPAAAWR